MFKFLIALLSLHSICLAGWISSPQYGGGIKITYVNDQRGSENMKTMIQLLKRNGQLSLLRSVTFPSFTKDDDYQTRLKEALLKVAPIEAKKIFSSAKKKPWAYYHKLQQSLGDAMLTLDEFHDVNEQLEAAGYKLGAVRAEKFSYFRWRRKEPILFGIHPHAMLLPIFPKQLGIHYKEGLPNLSGYLEKDGSYYLKCGIYPCDQETVKVKGYWSPKMNSYIASQATLYHHDGEKWVESEAVNTPKGTMLKMSSRGIHSLLIPISKLEHRNYCISIEIEGSVQYSDIFSPPHKELE